MQREPVVGQLSEVWASIVAACRGIGTDQWERPTDCPGWTVKDQLSHLIGVERMVDGEPPPAALTELPAYVANPFGAVNEAWVASRRGVPGPLVLDEFEQITRHRIEVLEHTDEEGFAVVGWSPVGEVPLREFMRTRLIDSWAHEQDIRRALDRPGGRNGSGEAAVLDQCMGAMPFVVGKRAAPPDGTVVRCVLRPLERTATVVMVDGRAVLTTDEAAGLLTPAVTLSLDQQAFWRLCYGRVAAGSLGSDEVDLVGDTDLGQRILDSMAFMM